MRHTSEGLRYKEGGRRLGSRYTKRAVEGWGGRNSMVSL